VRRLRFPLWTKLALFGVLGVAATHSMHLVIGRDIASAAVSDEQAARGQDIARLVARQVADAVLVEDQASMQEAVENVASAPHVAWCFIERDGKVLASSLPAGTPAGLVGLRRGPPEKTAPLVVRSGGARYLDVAAPILDGQAGAVRVGLDMRPLEAAQYDLGTFLGLAALATMVVGVIAAFLVGGRVARPVKELLAAADGFDPAVGSASVPTRGNDEFADLAVRFNEMMKRLRAAHEERQASLQKAASAERLVALGSLVAGVAHEVNNPLAGLKNVHAALKRGDLPAERQREYVDLMGDSLGRIQAIVARLLEFGRPRPLTLKAEPVKGLAQGVVRLVGPALRQRDVTLVELDEGLGQATALADRLQVGQALLNLVLNALYVTPAGGQVRLRLRRRAGAVGIAVEDDGPGIPVELRERVLDPFFSTKPEGEGTGLGLSVTRNIVDAHQGELAFDFPARGGTVVTVWLREAAPA